MNSSADANEQRYAQRAQDSNVRNVGFFESSTAPLTGNSVVAEVNGKPIFVDDVIPGIRERIENDARIRDAQKQVLLRQTVQKRLKEHIDQEIVLQALYAKVPEERRESLKEVLEPSFQKVLANIKKEKNLKTDTELEAELGKEGLTISQLRDTFLRIQMVTGMSPRKRQPPKRSIGQNLSSTIRNISTTIPIRRVSAAGKSLSASATMAVAVAPKKLWQTP